MCQAEDGVKLRRFLLQSRRYRLAGTLLVPLALSACAANPFGSSSKEELAPATPASERILDPKADNADPALGPSGANCPQIVAWPDDRLLTVYQAGQVGDALAIRHRGEITKMSRECTLYGDRVIVKYGFAGRVLLGPKGQPGTVTLPVSVRVSDSDRKTLASDSMKISTTIPAGTPAGYFSMVKEVSFPIRMGTRPQDYKIFVAFERNVPGAG